LTEEEKAERSLRNGPTILRVKEGEYVLQGILVKTNRFGCDQNRLFKLTRDGRITYFSKGVEKGAMVLIKGQRCRKFKQRTVNI
jgi:hypothetical protein